MNKLYENCYNAQLARDASKLKLWRNVGFLLTYKCPAACEFCYYNCGPDKSGLMPLDTALSAWEALMDLADNDPKIHITGGEPFLYYDHLAELMTRAKTLKLTPPDMIETNGFWAVDKKLISERLRFLASAGMKRLKVSWDPFHAEYIDPEPVKLLVETAIEILGTQRVLVRWEKYLQEPVSKIREISEIQRLDLYRSAIADYPVRFTGRASERLAGLSPLKPAESFTENCKQDFLAAKGVHIDPYGNVFSGQCSGIIIGNVNQTPLDVMWKQFDPQTREMVDSLFIEGPSGLLPKALKAGYQLKSSYSDKCHFCSELRQFFFDIGMFNSIIGPCDCYQSSPQKIKEKVLVKE